ncbi:AAA family ATPase [Pedosphaera parvula]|uniref:ATPase associated with various cellular activities AAA_5 n=1 Tax=Pedosphaera parvula (strain Ellin514) TaxID=320771 RepID=B9XN88_PEDPL|nr:AAA family ATPase [Pedosphaera parvula]EEF58750.1 ATPase associated with various cellular activities AAA_5 [Pedosphaera parvula Ellin514]
MTSNSILDIGRRLGEEVLQPMKQAFVGKDEVIDLLGVCLVGGENLFILGPPGTAKSALVHNLAARLEGQTFDYLLTRFTEPNELFGPFDIRKLREGELITNTEGMLPEASLVFLDELLNANSAILNSLLTALNERMFRRGKESRPLKALLFVGASNHLPEDDALKALFDRFLLRVHCDNVGAEQLADVLAAGWKLNQNRITTSSLHFDEIQKLQGLLTGVDLTPVRDAYAELVHRIRHAGIPVSDRRAVKLQKLIAASALLCGRLVARNSDLWVLKYIWDTDDQQEVLQALVDKVVSKSESEVADHVRARPPEGPDPESLARDLDFITERLKSETNGEQAYLQDRLGLLEGRCQWVKDSQKRDFLTKRIAELWPQLKSGAVKAV